jgi:hypothetical protein
MGALAAFVVGAGAFSTSATLTVGFVGFTASFDSGFTTALALAAGLDASVGFGAVVNSCTVFGLGFESVVCDEALDFPADFNGMSLAGPTCFVLDDLVGAVLACARATDDFGAA